MAPPQESGSSTPALATTASVPLATPSPPPSLPKTPLIFSLRLSLLIHVALFSLTALSFFNQSLFGYHPTLMALCFFLLLPEGILLSVRGPGIRKTALYLHMYVTGAAGLAGLLGLVAIYTNKERQGKAHLTTPHAWAGVLSFGCCCLVALGGIPMLFDFPQFLHAWGISKLIKKLHKQVGPVVFASGVVAAILGLQTFQPHHHLHKGAVTYTIAALAVVSVLLVFGAIQMKKAVKKQRKQRKE